MKFYCARTGIALTDSARCDNLSLTFMGYPNGLGALMSFAAFEKGGKASIDPLVTVAGASMPPLRQRQTI